MWLASFRGKFVTAVLDMLWAHWGTLGVRARGSTVEKWPVDPEGLVTVTVSFGRYDPRLFDAAVQWLSENSQWMNNTRLQRLSHDLSDEDRDILSAVSQSVLVHQTDKKWQRLAGGGREKVNRVPVELFLKKDGSPLPSVGPADPLFLERGFLRPRLERRKVTDVPESSRPGNLRIRLRGLFGLTSRAEIFLFLLTHDIGHARLVSRQTHFAYAPVARALKQMALAGVLSERSLGREVEYTLRRSNEWMEALDLQRMAWVEWVRVFRALRMILSCIADLQARSPSEAILGPELYRCSLSASRLIEGSELDFVFQHIRGELHEYVPVFEQDVRRLFRRIGGRFEA